MHSSPLVGVLCLHSDHVSAFAVLVQQSAGRGPIFERSSELDDVAA
jgi:hypothetical protein